MTTLPNITPSQVTRTDPSQTQTTSIAGLGSTSKTATDDGTKSGSASLGKDDFLKLFVAQLQHQDPMKPMDDASQMAQMASFSTLEQTSNIAKSMSSLVTNAGMGQSLGLIGKTVTYVDAAGATQTGVVDKVTTEGGTATLTVGGKTGVQPGSITSVATTQTPSSSQETSS